MPELFQTVPCTAAAGAVAASASAVAMYAVAAAYDPIADQKVPAPRAPVRPFNGAGRKMLQWGNSVGQQAGIFGPYYTGHAFW